jgi:hypothetical protein
MEIASCGVGRTEGRSNSSIVCQLTAANGIPSPSFIFAIIC